MHAMCGWLQGGRGEGRMAELFESCGVCVWHVLCRSSVGVRLSS